MFYIRIWANNVIRDIGGHVGKTQFLKKVFGHSFAPSNMRFEGDGCLEWLTIFDMDFFILNTRRKSSHMGKDRAILIIIPLVSPIDEEKRVGIFFDDAVGANIF